MLVPPLYTSVEDGSSKHSDLAREWDVVELESVCIEI